MTKFSANGLVYLAHCENNKLRAYKDGAGVWTLGTGHTEGVKEGDTCTPEQSVEFLAHDTAIACSALARMCPVTTPAQFDGMASLAYNVGTGAAGFLGSHVRQYHMAGNYAAAADAFLMWDKEHNPETGKLEYSRGLHKRRIMDRAIYLGATADEAVKAGDDWLAAQDAPQEPVAPAAEAMEQAAAPHVEAVAAEVAAVAVEHPTEPVS